MYVSRDGKKLRKGFTTGTTATAALKAFLEYHIYNSKPDFVEVSLPGGEKIGIPVKSYSSIDGQKYASVRKDAGDDADITNGCLISVTCDFENTDGNSFVFDSEYGVGKITKEGLGIKIGEPAINEVPREMMIGVLREYGIDSAKITVNVENGEELAKSTLNGKLGIIGGISIIGTSGIVEPMSEQAWKESLLPQMDILRANGFDEIILIPGGVGEKYFISHFGKKENVILCGNHFGFAIKNAATKGFVKIHIAGAFQKIIKLAGGNWNTDSRYSDSKAEILAIHTIISHEAYDKKIVEEIFSAQPFSTVIQILQKNKYDVIKIFENIAETTVNKLSVYLSGVQQDISFRITMFNKGDLLINYDKTGEK